MRFKNLKTGNIVSSEDKGVIALMKKSSTYEELPEKKGKKNDKDEAKSDT